jgi:hypothetical protein
MSDYIKNFELEDLVYYYPTQDEPGIQTLLTERKEFASLATKKSIFPSEKPQRGKFFNHQTFIHRLLLIWDYHFLIHRTGTGKTCASGGGGEVFRRTVAQGIRNYIDNYIRPQKSHIRKVYVLVSGPTLEEEFRKQLVNQCSEPGDYDTSYVNDANTDKGRRRRLNKEINEFYEILTYGMFAKEIISKNMSDEEITEKYSGCLFIVDEVHNLRTVSREEKDKDEVKKKKQTYNTIKRVFQNVLRSKFMLLSATPMVNEAWEIAYIMDLLLPKGVTMPSPKTHNYENITIEELEPYFRGKISFVREEKSVANVIYEGETIQANYEINGKIYPSQQQVKPSIMLEGPVELVVNGVKTKYDGQKAAYLDAVNSKSPQDGFRDPERQASNFVWPDGSTGREAFNRFTIRKSGDHYEPRPEVKFWFQNLEIFKYLSCKFVDIFKQVDSMNGTSFIFSNYLYPSGIYILAMLFEAQGYSRFDESKSIFSDESIDLDQLIYDIKKSGRRNVKERTATISRKKRFAVLTSETSQLKFQNILDTFNSIENRYGDFIRVLLTSPVGGEGINTANAVQFFLVEAQWNDATVYQAISRILRALSHLALLFDKVEKLVNEGMSIEEAKKTARVDVHIYQMAAITSGDENPSVDLQLYMHSEKKQIAISRILRMMKRTANDFYIHRERNIRDDDVDNSKDCDYDVCNYEG